MNYKGIIISFVMTIAPLCMAMNIPTKNSKIRAVGFPTDDKIVVAGDHCCEIYSTTKRLSLILSDDGNDGTVQDPIYDMALSPNGKKMALVKAKKTILYDIAGEHKKEKELDYDWRHRVSSSDNELYVYNRHAHNGSMSYYHYFADESFDYNINVNKWAHYAGKKHPIIIISLNHRHSQCYYFEKFPSGEFNYAGDFLAINMRGNNYRFETIGHTQESGFELPKQRLGDKDIFYISIAFHKNNITAALLNSYGCVEFWDYKNQEWLGIMCCNGDEEMLWKDRDCRNQLLSFSPNGEQLVMSLGHKVLVYKTPCEAVCVRGTAEDCITLLCALKNSSLEISKDVIWNIINAFLWLSELTNKKAVDKIIERNRSKLVTADVVSQKIMTDKKVNDTSNLRKLVEGWVLGSAILVSAGICAFVYRLNV